MLEIYNSYSNKKEKLTPMEIGKIKMYVCGMTVYDYCHLGHARVLVSFDMVSRYLRSIGYDVTFVCNITDIDDKIIARANERGKEVTELTNYFIQAMHADCQRLNVLPPDIEPRATEYMPQMVSMIETLIEKGFAYVADNGDVYYDVSKFENYGKLSNQDIEKLHSGVRVEVIEAKKNALDFVLWKMAKEGEPSWPSPWGNGRPGWHIECSAMSLDCLGEQFDIHGGGPDLKFPHHENEIAQSEAATGKRFANTWMHVGALTMNKEKMSKSLGNIMAIREVTKQYSAEVIRFFLLSSHYRSPLNYSDENLQNAYLGLRRIYIALRNVEVVQLDKSLIETNVSAKAFHNAMQDDFNTPVALSVLFDMTHQINKLTESAPEEAKQLAALLKHLAEPLGLIQANPNEFLQADVDKEEVAKIEALISKRERARENKNWQEADKVRDQLAAMSVELEDSASGTVWRKRY